MGSVCLHLLRRVMMASPVSVIAITATALSVTITRYTYSRCNLHMYICGCMVPNGMRYSSLSSLSHNTLSGWATSAYHDGVRSTNPAQPPWQWRSWLRVMAGLI